MPLPHTVIIAEAGVNHNGSLDLAKALIDAAADAGADIVKFQSFDADALATNNAARAQYQIDNLGEDGSQREMLRKLQLDDAGHQTLFEHCRSRNIGFLSTAFDFASFDMLKRFDMPYIKIPSGDLTFGPMLLAAGRTEKRIILSTGMATLGEIADALAVLAFGMLNEGEPKSLEEMHAHAAGDDARAILAKRLTILHCVTQYPCPPAFVNLAAIATIGKCFGLPVGYSDHSLGIAVPIAAVARGAVMIEKHVTLDRDLPGPDHIASLEPDEFSAMVAGIREVELAIGTGAKNPTKTEMANRLVARRSLVAARQITDGETISADMITAKRPGTGMSPMSYWDVIGSRAIATFATDDPIAS